MSSRAVTVSSRRSRLVGCILRTKLVCAGLFIAVEYTKIPIVLSLCHRDIVDIAVVFRRDLRFTSIRSYSALATTDSCSFSHRSLLGIVRRFHMQDLIRLQGDESQQPF
ncbi:predicted protein [Sclerotinia sclerotiorum 1980 UF-70]|uniref:Uncharacterized protein n=1 Tax=Sclerotinia sclerotiorum (strain ATCC 18683 / 1980 / Ss-1) TaxID=665079 RepID=A7E6W8_SCLS1|nr:predicted protein [Sclerotinia sclerotiorum 1980 UF-70]EDN91640.1 predicted protein [Sclerotinia sclerotiorum 1980 UF-70]